MRSKSFEGMACSIAGVLDAVGDRWAVLILRDLSLGLSKYEDLRKSTMLPMPPCPTASSILKKMN